MPVPDLLAAVSARQIRRFDAQLACEGLMRVLNVSRHIPLFRASHVARGAENRTDMRP